MKRWKKTGWLVLMAVIILGSMEACKKDKDEQEYNLSGSASGAQEVPAVTTTGTATLTGEYDGDDNKLEYKIEWKNLSGTVTQAHIHGPAFAGANAGVLIPLTIMLNGTSGKLEGTASLPDSTEQFLLSGKLYYNLHTTLHAGGEIRGQITATKD
ncbi:CHRD domain-containing protein [Lacibacter sp. H375]|uniref:CHRD domain-containing protein n=1 Tax=Lacibacter sp. H375 TaxID=3133424 RepID=UPI0030C55BC5